MKKLLLLLSVLLAGVSGAWADATFTVDTSNPLTSVAQIKTDECYVLYNMGRGKYMNVDVAANQIRLTASLPNTAEELLPFIIRFEENTNAKTDGGAYQIKFYNGTYMDWTTPVHTRASMGNLGYVPTYDTDHFYFTTWANNAAKTSLQYINGNDDYVVFYSNITDGNNSNYAIYKVTPAFNETITVGPETGTYYGGDGKPTTTWGGTWKSTLTSGGTPLLTIVASSGMNAAPDGGGDMYAKDGTGHTYRLTAADGYVITGYTLNGTAKNSNITIHPQLRKNTTITNGSSLGEAVSVSGLDLNCLTFSLISSNASDDYLDNPTLKVSLEYTGMKSYTNPVANETLAQIGYKHISTGASRYMMFLKSDGGAARSAHQVSSTFDDIPANAAFFVTIYNASERAYYFKELESGNYLKAQDIEMSTDLSSGNKNVLTIASLPVSGDKSLFQWTLEDGGTYVATSSYYIRPKLNTSTAIAVYTSDNNYYSFHDASPSHYDFAHAFLFTKSWKDQIDTYLTEMDVWANLAKAGVVVGYPKDIAANTGALNTAKGSYDAGTYDESVYNAIKNGYETYIAASEIVMPTDGKVYSFINVQKDESKFYLNNIEGILRPVSYTEGSTVIPATGEFVCHKASDNTFVFVSKSGLYVQGASNGSTDNPSAAALSSTYNSEKQTITITKFPATNETYVTLPSSGALFSFGKIWMQTQKGANRNDKTDFIIKGADTRFDAATGAFLDGSYSSAYYLKEVDDYYNKVNLFSNGTDAYASLYLPFSVTIPEGITAYAVQSQDGTYAHMEAIVTDGTLPKNTATILKKNGQTSNTSIYLSPAVDAGSFSGTNLLGGTVDTKTRESLGTGTTYVLANIDGDDDGNLDGIGLYNYEGTNLAKGKAYLFVAGGGVKALTFNFGDAVGVNAIDNGQLTKDNDKVIFNLAGQRMSRVQKGVNIVNGKKVLVK